jgi:hypothetical protein
MTVSADLKAITLTGTAKSAASAKGTDIGGLQAAALRATSECQVALKAFLAVHPSTGGDAANFASIQAVIAELN